MATPALLATALRYGLNPASTQGLDDDQLRKFIQIRKRSGAKLGPRPRPKPRPKPVPDVHVGGGKLGLPGYTIKHDPKTGIRFVGDDPMGQALESARPENRTQSAINKRNQQRRETIRRQMQLKTAGFNIVVDGIWGPRSQASWNKYRNHRPAPVIDPKGSRPNQAIPFNDPAAEAQRQQQQFRVQKQQQAERAKIVKDKKAALIADAKLAQQRKVILARGKALHQNPKLGATMSLKDLTAVLIDKQTGFDLATSKAAATAIQLNLQAHGYTIKLTGVPDKQTYDTLKIAFRDSERRETRKRLNAIQDQVLTPLGLKPGDKATGFPTGTVPTLAELDTILHTGGFMADQVMRYINRGLGNTADAFDTARWRQLDWIASKRTPFYNAKGTSKLFPNPSHFDTITALMAPFDYVGADRADLTKPKITGKDAVLSQFKGQTIFDTQLHAVLTSSSPDEMKKKLIAYDALNEQKFKAKQAELAKHKGFWGKTFDALLVPGELTFTGATLATSRIIQEGAQLAHLDAGERDLRWEDAQIMLGYAKPEDYPELDYTAGRASPWLTVPGSLVIDPLNFVAPFKAGSTLARFGRGASSLGHYGIKGEGLFGKALVYEKGTWSKLAVAEKVPGVTSLLDTPIGTQALAFGKKLVEDKDRAMIIVRGRINQAARHSFEPVNKFAKAAIKVKKPKNVAEIQATRAAVRAWLADPDNPEAQGILKELRDAKASLYLDAPRSTTSNVGASFLANMAEKIRVLAGHQFATGEALRLIDQLGFEQIRQQVDTAFGRVAELKAVTGYDAVEANMNQAFKLYKDTGDKIHLKTALDAKATLTKLEGGFRQELDDARKLNARKKDIQQQISDAYNEIVEAAGTYIKGGALKDDGHLMARQILARTLQKMDAVEDTIMPVLQDILDDLADEAFEMAKKAKAVGEDVPELAARSADEAAGTAAHGADEVVHPLWDEAGLWVGRNGEEAAALRARAARAFDPENLAKVPNPAHNVGHTMGEMAEAIQFEVKRGLPRIFNYAHREAMRLGDEFTFDANKAADDLEQEIHSAWEQRPDGLFYDTRPEIEVNKLYARNFNSVAEGFAKDLKNYLDGDGALDLAGLERIAAGAPKGMADGFDDSWNSLLWQLGSRFKSVPGMEMKLAEDTTRVKHAVRAPDEITNQKARIAWENSENKRLAEFSSAVSSHRVQLAIASDELMPGELSRDLLFMRALAVHQAKWAKATYLTLNGFLRMWKFATLPLRPGWVVRNVVDNFAKAMVRSVRDPRTLLLGAENPGSGIRTVFDIGVAPLRGAIRLIDGLRGTKALDEFDRLLEIFWNYPADILTKFFDLAALPAPPKSVLDASRFSKQLEDWRAGSRATISVTLDDYAKAGLDPPLRLQKLADRQAYEKMMARGDATAAQRLAYKMRKTPDTLWELMGNKPENYFKRVIYRSELKKNLSRLQREGVTGVEAQMQAHEKAWDVVTETLFDYGKVSVVEDNMRIFMPFIQFWRKNTWFWMQTGVDKPWLPLSVLKLDQQRRMAHDDLPDWMQRYFHVNEIVDAAGVIPGLDTLVRQILPADHMIDPTSFLSFAPLHRVFRDLVYGDNQFLPPEDRAYGIAGKIFGPIVRAMDEWGLGLNPLVRKPMEVTGLIDSRDWQAVFPQTSLAEAFTMKFWSEDAAFKVANWERVFTFGEASHAKKLASNFDFYVNREMAHQVIAGRPVSREEAEATVKSRIFVEQLWGYFSGTYWRSATPEDIYIAKLQDDLRKGVINFDDLPDRSKTLLSVWSRTTGGAEAFDRYLANLQLIQAFYQEPDFNERAEMLKSHPALAEYVDVKPVARTVGKNWIKNAQRYTDTARYFNAVDFINDVDPAPELRDDAFDMFVTPDLEKFWARNDTPKQIRDRMVKAEIHRTFKSLNESYFKIPATDYEAKDGFLKEHPELIQYWNKWNNPSDNFEAIMGATKADLRTLYMHIVDTKGFEAAAPILKRFPFMFEGTKSEKKIKDGEWIVGYGKKGWTDARRKDWKQVASFSHWFFNSYVKKVGFDKAYQWLRDSKDPRAKQLLAYFDKYPSGKSSKGGRGWTPEHREAWGKVADFAKWFFDDYMKKVGEEKAFDWLYDSNDPKAQALVAYFRKYPSGDSKSSGKSKWTPQHRQDWSKVAEFSKWFFDTYMEKVGEEKAFDWLYASNDPKAKALVAYFRKYPSGKAGKKPKPGWTPARYAAWAKVADYAHWFFDTYMKKVGEDKAFDFLYASDDPKAQALVAYFRKFPSGDSKSDSPSANWSPERKAHWARVATFARWFYDFYLPKVGEDTAWNWLREQTSPTARQFMAYVDKYSTKEGKGKFSAERRNAYLDIKDFMGWFYDDFLPKVGEKRAWEWLRESENPQAQAMVAYLAKWGKHSQKSLDYKKAQHWLTLYHDMPEDQRQAWLDGNSDGARIVRWYFDKYANSFDLTQHGKDYISIKDTLKTYFAIPKDQRTAWLESGSPEATAVLAYFKKYGKTHQYEREFKNLIAEYPDLANGTPEQARRMQFWSQYFALTPDARPAFVHKYAEDYGIFIYGDLSETVRYDQEAEYDRRAVGLGLSKRATDFLYVRPLLAFYETLGKEDRQFFLKANPELQDYFDRYSTNSPTGDAKLDLLVEHYFLFPENSALRSKMLKDHPELQDFFDAKASPAVRAMRAVLEQYFSIKNPQARMEFMRKHPEIRDYFDQRRAERASEREQLDAFDESDPRLRPYYEDNADMRRSADMMARKLHHAAIRSLEDATAELQLRRERQPVG